MKFPGVAGFSAIAPLVRNGQITGLSVLDSLAKKRAHDDFRRNFFHIREGRGIRCNLC